MIQLNLLPDVKLNYIKAQKNRRLVFAVSVIISALTVVLLIALLSIDGLQKKHLDDLNKNIANETSQLQGQPQINQILTVQNQLNSLTGLHNAKPAASRLFDTYLNAVTPAQDNITDFTIDFSQNMMTVTGTSNDLSSVNAYVDTLKNTTYTVGSSSASKLAFNNVVLSSFSINTSTSQNTGQPVNYTITADFDPTIYNITDTVKLIVPNLTITHATAANPTNSFNSTATPTTPSTPNTGGQ